MFFHDGCGLPLKEKKRKLYSIPLLYVCYILLVAFWHTNTHIYTWPYIWLQSIGQIQLQDETRNILVLRISATYIRGLTVYRVLTDLCITVLVDCNYSTVSFVLKGRNCSHQKSCIIYQTLRYACREELRVTFNTFLWQSSLLGK